MSKPGVATRLQLEKLREHGAGEHVPDPHGAGALRVEEEAEAARGDAAVLRLECLGHPLERRERREELADVRLDLLRAEGAAAGGGG